MKVKIILAIAALAAGTGLLIARQPTPETRLAAAAPKLNSMLRARKVQIDPGELLEISNGNAMSLRIYDVRSESDYNLFHIADSERVDEKQLKDPRWAASLPTQTIKVFVSNDERAATKAWELLAAQNVPDIYVLEGGINKWIEIYAGHSGARRVAAGEDVLKYSFPAAFGAAQPGAEPDPHHSAERKFKKKVKPVGPAGRKSGGCG